MDHESMELPIFSSSIAIVLSAAISVVASLIMVTASLCTKQYKDHLAKMAILMLIGDIIFFIPKVVAGQSFEKSETFCRTAAFFIEFGGNSAFFWAPAFAHALYSVAKNERIDILQKNFVYYLLFAVAFPLPYALYAAIFCSIDYNRETEQCFHISINGVFDYQYAFVAIVPFFIASVPTIFYYVKASRHLRKYIRGAAYYKDILTLFLYPAILLVCWTPILTVSILWSIGYKPATELFIIFEALANLQGLFDALAYGSSKKFFKKCLKSVNCRKRKIQPRKKTPITDSLRATLKRKAIGVRASTGASSRYSTSSDRYALM